jgi:hypothetical protein
MDTIQITATRIIDAILKRAAGRSYKSVPAIRQWMRIEFGLSARFKDLGPLDCGWLELPRHGDGCRIVVNSRLQPYRQIRVLIHELAEWMEQEFSEILDDDETQQAAPDQIDPELFRHRIALAVEEQMVERWGIESQPSSFSAYDRHRISSPYGFCGFEYTVVGGQPDTQRIDPLNDACL